MLFAFGQVACMSTEICMYVCMCKTVPANLPDPSLLFYPILSCNKISISKYSKMSSIQEASTSSPSTGSGKSTNTRVSGQLLKYL